MKTSPTFATSAVSALRWNYAGSVARMILSLGINIFLTRLLGPKPFGLLSVALIVNSLAGLLGDVGVSSALIQKKELDDGDIRFGFTIQCTLGLVLTCLLFLVAPLSARFFRDPGLLPILRVLSMIFLIQGPGLTSIALLKRRLDFRTLQACFIGSYLFGYLAVGVPLALAGAGVWSLICAQLSQITVQTITLYSNVRHSLRPLWDPRRSSLLTFGARVLGANLSSWGISNLDNTFVGRVDGSAALGLYGRAFLLAQLPGEAVVSTLMQVLLPFFSRVQADKRKLSRVYEGAVGSVALVLFPFFAAMAVVPYQIIVGLYGTKWLGAVAVFSPLALSMPVNAMMALSGPALAAVGKPQKEMQAQAIGLGFAAVAFWIAVHYSLAILGWSVFAIYLVRFYLLTSSIRRELRFRWADLLEVIWPAFALAGVTTSTAILTKMYVPSTKPIQVLTCIVAVEVVIVAVTMSAASKLLLVPIFKRIPELRRVVPQRLQEFLPGLDRSNPSADNGAISGRYVLVSTVMQRRGDTGVQTHLNTVIDYLELKGNEVGFVGIETSSWRRVHSVVSRLSGAFNRQLQIFLQRELAVLLLAGQYRRKLGLRNHWVIYAQCAVSARAALLVRRKPTQRVVLAVHFNVSHAEEIVSRGRATPGGWLYRSVLSDEINVLRQVDGTIIFSQFMYKELSKRHKLEPERVMVVPNTAVVSKQANEVDPKSDLIAIGTLEPRKNQAYILRVLHAASARGLHFRLSLVGHGEDRQRLEQLSQDLRLSHLVTFVGYKLNASELIGQHKVLVHSALVENMPITLIEAMAAGVPIIAPSVGGIPEIFDDGVEGFFWPLDDPERGADILCKLMAEPSAQHRMAAAARARYKSQFEPAVILSALTRFLLKENSRR